MFGNWKIDKGIHIGELIIKTIVWDFKNLKGGNSTHSYYPYTNLANNMNLRL